MAWFSIANGSFEIHRPVFKFLWYSPAMSWRVSYWNFLCSASLVVKNEENIIYFIELFWGANMIKWNIRYLVFSQWWLLLSLPFVRIMIKRPPILGHIGKVYFCLDLLHFPQGFPISHSVMDCIVPSQKLYVDTLTNNVTVFRDRAFKEVIKVKWGKRTEG